MPTLAERNSNLTEIQKASVRSVICSIAFFVIALLLFIIFPAGSFLYNAAVFVLPASFVWTSCTIWYSLDVFDYWEESPNPQLTEFLKVLAVLMVFTFSICESIGVINVIPNGGPGFDLWQSIHGWLILLGLLSVVVIPICVWILWCMLYNAFMQKLGLDQKEHITYGPPIGSSSGSYDSSSSNSDGPTLMDDLFAYRAGHNQANDKSDIVDLYTTVQMAKKVGTGNAPTTAYLLGQFFGKKNSRAERKLLTFSYTHDKIELQRVRN